MKSIRWVVYDSLVIVVCGIALALMPLRYIRRIIPGRKTHSLWAGTPIINMAINAKAEKLLGVDSRSLVYNTYYVTEAFDYNLSRYQSLPLIGKLLPLVVFAWACFSIDRLHFYCDRGLLPSRRPFTFDYRELFVYRMLRIPVFFWTYGADVRGRSITKKMGEPNCCSYCDSPGRYCSCDDVRTKENIDKLFRSSRAVFAGMGDMFYYTPGSINNTFFWPVDLDAGEKYKPIYPNKEINRPLRIVHASNHRIFKGTEFLIKAVNELKAEGLSIELVLVEKMPNVEALEVYRSADIIFDQCVMGNYGYFALEGLAMGKPVMCFIREPEKYLLHPKECPIINTHIDSLKEDIRYQYNHREDLHEIGMRGRQYIERHFTLEAFAKRLGTTYEHLGVKI